MSDCLAKHLSAYGYDMLLPRGSPNPTHARMGIVSGSRLGSLFAQQQGQGAYRTLSQLGAAFERELEQLMSQHERVGPPPLWLQCLLQHTIHTSRWPMRRAQMPAPGEPFPRCGIMVSPDIHHGLDLINGLQAGRPAQEMQDFVSIRVLQPAVRTAAPAVLAAPYTAWGPCLLCPAIQHRAPSLLAWSLQPEQQQQIWGDVPDRPTMQWHAQYYTFL